jgi:hypothetical protein
VSGTTPGQAAIDAEAERWRAGLKDYCCGLCGEEFRSNCDAGDIACVECDARLCPCCGAWFSESGEMAEALEHRAAMAQLADAVTPTAADFDHAAEIIALRELVAEILADSRPAERFEGISEGLRDHQARVDDWRKRARLEPQR